MGFHKIGNPTDAPAVSLHIYSPPFSSCRVWLDANKPSEVLRPVCTYFSEYGEIIDYGDASPGTGTGSAPPAGSRC